MLQQLRRYLGVNTWQDVILESLAGLAICLFSIPGGMAFARLAGLHPIYGLYSTMSATVVASLFTGSTVMICTVTGAIALTTGSVLSGLVLQNVATGTALATLSFMVGTIMLVLGMLRLGTLLRFISNAVLVGFVAGVAALIVIGQLGALVGISIPDLPLFARAYYWISNAAQWDPSTATIGFASLLLVLVPRHKGLVRQTMPVLVIFVSTLLLWATGWETVTTVHDLILTSLGRPNSSLPSLALLAPLSFGALAVAIIALVEGAAISTAFPNPDGTKADSSRDFLGAGLGNVCGAFFSSMPTGGSLSRTGVGHVCGAKSRLAGVATGLWMIPTVYFGSGFISLIPVASIAGVLSAVALQVLIEKWADIRLVLRTASSSATAMIVTFVCTLVIAIEWAIALGVLISWILYLYKSSEEVKLVALRKTTRGSFEEVALPRHLESSHLIIVELKGNGFFSEVPVVSNLVPITESAKGSVIIWRLRGVEDVHSTFLRWLEAFSRQLKNGGNRLILEGVEPHVARSLYRTGLAHALGEHNIYPAQAEYFASLFAAESEAQRWLRDRARKA